VSASPSPSIQRAVIADRYAIRRKLGSGSIGTVYLAFDELERREVALKIIRTEALIARAAGRMQEEFRAIAALEHPQIARAYDFGYTDQDGVPFYTREYVPGRPLPPGPPAGQSPEDFLRPVLDLLEAIDHAHARGILHLDIHAGNLILADDPGRGGVLIDFGLAPTPRAIARSSGAAEWATLPPELLSGEPASALADVHLAGRLLFYRLTGRQSGAPALPREISGWGARRTLELERIAQKALQPDPRERFAAASEMRSALAAAVGCAPGPRMRAEPGSELVGRDAELARLDQALGTALDSRPVVLCLVAGAGTGKSRLLEEARLRAQIRGVETLCLRFAPEAGPESSLVRALERLGRRGHGAPTWLKPLSPSHGGSPQERARRTAEAYFLEDGKPLVLILDDVDRADRESAVLIGSLIAECQRRSRASIRGRGLALLLSMTPECPLRPGAASRIRLQPLSREAARRLFLAFIRPLDPPRTLVRAAIAAARGSPLRLRRLTIAVREEWRERRAIPPTAALPLEAMESPNFRDWKRLSEDERSVLGALAILRRPASLAELAAATALTSSRAAGSLRRLAAFEVTLESGRGAGRAFQLASSAMARELMAGVGRGEARRIHERVVRYLRGKPQPTVAERDHLARHLLALGRRPAGVRLAVDAAIDLRRQGSRDQALALLELAVTSARGREVRLQLIELMSDILGETGDHLRGAALLEPFLKAEQARLEPRVRVRLARRLGTHHHRAGLSGKALQVFAAGRKIAGARCDLEDILLIESEIAELQIFQGNLRDAEEACESGLRRIEEVPAGAELRRRMEVMLRASLGHIELRRLRFARARSELKRALALGRLHGTTGDRAAILLNLGVVENEASDFTAARRRFEEAERLLTRVGASQDLIKVSTNLALTAAKLGDRAGADLHLERAASLLAHFPVERLDCFVAYSRGLVRHIFGDCEEALEALDKAIALSRALGDRVMTSFARVHAAEAALLTGRHGAALSYLRAVKGPEKASLPILGRMTASRLFLVETLLGRRRRAEEALRQLYEIPRGDVLYLETWNDWFAGLGSLARGEDASPMFELCQQAFARMRVTHGVRFARLCLLAGAIAGGDKIRIRKISDQVELDERKPHRLLQVAEPLLLAHARLALDDVEAAGERLAAAGSAIVGLPYIELDWQIELLRVQSAIRRGDLGEARRHLHRATHSRSLLLELVPARNRQSFLAHARFHPLREAEEHLGLLPAREPSTERARRSMGLDALVGGSAAMLELYRGIERLGGQDFPILFSGETGTGKELAARAVHRRSARRDRPFRVIHCASLPPELFESELFGHVAGAFTGAERDQVGIFEDAAGGTILLDDVHLLPFASQAKLLGVVESKCFRKLGGVEPVTVDVRFFATTSIDLRQAVADSRFLEGLYYRLARVELRAPPLRERKEDIPLLARHILEQHGTRLDRPVSSLKPDAEALLAEHDWPGNVRELEALLLRALITLSRPESISAADLEPLLGSPRGSTRAASTPRTPGERARELLGRKLEAWRGELERDYITALFLELKGDVPSLLAALGVSRTRLYEWCREIGVDIRALRKRL
jgi:DNA-binding NtrC family response regulator